MKKGRRKLLRGLTYVFAGIAAVSMCKSITVRAAGINTSLSELNVGAAKYLDACDRGGDGNGPTAQSSEDDSSDDDSDGDSEESNLVMANVHNSLNVREEASEHSDKVGFMYADCGGEILEQEGNWTKIKSGNLVGWACNDYLLFGDEAEELASQVGITMATVTADALRVRKEPREDSGVWGLVAKGDEIEAITEDTTDDWVAINFAGEEGFISGEYVDINFTIDVGETMEEKKERESREDFTLLSALVYLEAGNQPYEGMLAVAAVVMNRVKSSGYPNSVSGVIYASGQFAPARGGRLEAQIEKGVPKACKEAAREALKGKSNIGGATHFRRYSGQAGTVIGAHVFY